MNLVRSWPQGQAGPTPLGWRPPQPLMPPRINGWPMGVVPSSDAEALLESAVAWWDASRYRDGDRWLRNQGIAGELLDLRLGSSTVANSNDPTWLGPESRGYVYLPGVSTNFLTTPSAAALDLTGDLTVVVTATADPWVGASVTATLMGKDNFGVNRSWYLQLVANGLLQFVWWDSGGTVRITTSSTALTAASGDRLTVRASLDVDNGAGGHEVKFYTSTDDGASWTQLGTTQNAGAFTTSVRVTITNVGVGASGGSGASAPWTGRIYAAALYSDATATTKVYDVDCDAITSGSATSFTATTGQTVTINRSTSGRKSVAQPARGKGGRACFLLGTDDYFEVPSDRVWQHQLLNFGQGDSFTVVAVVRRWDTQAVQNILSKRADRTTVTNAGWVLSSSTSNNALFRVADGTATGTQPTANNTQFTSGPLQVISGLRNIADNRGLRIQVNQSLGGRTADDTGSLTNIQPTRVGLTGTTYADMEFTAAAIFRRPLTTTELSSLSRYYGAS